jgi:hypothetical protein
MRKGEKDTADFSSPKKHLATLSEQMNMYDITL